MVGKTIAHYQILEKLGEGGMGVVYKARDTHLERFVAIKVLPTEKVADPERKRRFVQEAKAASALNHPNIITIYDIDQAEVGHASRLATPGGPDGPPILVDFIAMEYMEGKTLDELIPRKGMRLNEALKHSVEIADALAAAHAAGIVHRDLKPGNVMVTAEGRVKVLDFGLAKLTERLPASDEDSTATEQPSTETGLILGTVSYMSPEQAEGKKVDARSDIFSFGSVLYEMLTGRRAFRRDNPALTLAAILHLEPPPLPAEMPHDLQKIVTRCLRKEVTRRHQHMDEVKVALEELKEDSDSGKLAAGALPSWPAFRWRRTAALAAVALVLAAAGWLWYSRSRSTAPEVPLEAVPLTTFRGIEVCPSFSPDGNQVAFSWNGENEDNFDIYIQMIGSGLPSRRTDDASVDVAPAWSPDGKQIAFLRGLKGNQSAVMLMPTLEGRARLLTEISEVALHSGLQSPRIAWHPGGKHLVVTHGVALFLLSTETGEMNRLTTPPQGNRHLYPAFSPDGRSVVFTQQVGQATTDLYQLALDETMAPRGEPVQLTDEAGFIRYSAWTADGREIIFSAGSWAAPNLWRMSVSGPGAPQRLASLGEGVLHPALSRDGRRLAFTRTLWDTNIWRIVLSANGTARPDRAPLIASTRIDAVMQFSPDGSRIAFQSYRSGTLQVWICDNDGSDCGQVTSMGGPLTGTPRWSPDGRWIVFDSRPEGHGDIYTVLASGGRPRPLTAGPTIETVPSWSRDGKLVYFVSNRSGSAQVWKMPVEEGAASGEPVKVTQGGGGAAFESHDGKLIYYFRQGGLWQVPVEGGVESRVIQSVRSQFSFAVADKGIYFVPSDETEVRFFDFNRRAIRTVATITTPGGSWQRGSSGHLAASPDGRTILYTQDDTSGSDLMLVENFR